MDGKFKAQFKAEKKDKNKIYRYIRTATKDESAILPSEASIIKEWAPKIGNALPIQVKRYNPTGNNIPVLTARFAGNTNRITQEGNVKMVVEKINKLFFINQTVLIALKGSTTSSSIFKNLTPRQEGFNSPYIIDGVPSVDYTLNDLLIARARAGKSLLTKYGVKNSKRLIISNSAIYNDIIGVKSKSIIR